VDNLTHSEIHNQNMLRSSVSSNSHSPQHTHIHMDRRRSIHTACLRDNEKTSLWQQYRSAHKTNNSTKRYIQHDSGIQQTTATQKTRLEVADRYHVSTMFHTHSPPCNRSRVYQWTSTVPGYCCRC